MCTLLSCHSLWIRVSRSGQGLVPSPGSAHRSLILDLGCNAIQSTECGGLTLVVCFDPSRSEIFGSAKATLFSPSLHALHPFLLHQCSPFLICTDPPHRTSLYPARKQLNQYTALPKSWSASMWLCDTNPRRWYHPWRRSWYHHMLVAVPATIIARSSLLCFRALVRPASPPTKALFGIYSIDTSKMISKFP